MHCVGQAPSGGSNSPTAFRLLQLGGAGRELFARLLQCGPGEDAEEPEHGLVTSVKAGSCQLLQEPWRRNQNDSELLNVPQVAVGQRRVHHAPGVLVVTERFDVAAEGNEDLPPRVDAAVLQQVLHDKVPERVPAKLRHVDEDAVDQGFEPSDGEMLNQPLEHAAAIPVSSNTGRISQRLYFGQHEVHRRWRQQLYAALQHVVRVRRLDRAPHVALELPREPDAWRGGRRVEQLLKGAAAPFVLRHGPNGAASLLHQGREISAAGRARLRDLAQESFPAAFAKRILRRRRPRPR
mmetsp:Transcript_28663/g.78788  ORF Transcript_28663/g.78788 Transcript_28663/m.78788 type:complete len:294 (+) Transcript_28663:119-1000(+)